MNERGTGRTTRMLQDAVARCFETQRPVAVVIHNKQFFGYCASLVNDVVLRGSENTIIDPRRQRISFGDNRILFFSVEEIVNSHRLRGLELGGLFIDHSVSTIVPNHSALIRLEQEIEVAFAGIRGQQNCKRRKTRINRCTSK